MWLSAGWGAGAREAGEIIFAWSSAVLLGGRRRSDTSSLLLCGAVLLFSVLSASLCCSLQLCSSALLNIQPLVFMPAKVSVYKGTGWGWEGVVGYSGLGNATFGHKNRSVCSHVGLWAQAQGWNPRQGPSPSLRSISLPPSLSNVLFY